MHLWDFKCISLHIFKHSTFRFPCVINEATGKRLQSNYYQNSTGDIFALRIKLHYESNSARGVISTSVNRDIFMISSNFHRTVIKLIFRRLISHLNLRSTLWGCKNIVKSSNQTIPNYPTMQQWCKERSSPIYLHCP